MSISISSRTALFVAQTKARPGPNAIPLPHQEPVSASPPRGSVSKAPAISPSRVDFGATIDKQPAQDPPGSAQEGVGAGGPARDPGIEDESTIFADINGDNALNGEDITELLNAFNDSVTAADLNADGTVDTADLGILINAIRDFNTKSKPDITFGDGQDRNLRTSHSAKPSSDRVQISEPNLASLTPGVPLPHAPGNQDEPVAQPGVFGDLSGDGIVNNEDLAMLRKSFGQSGAIGDLNGDGRVDTADLGSLLGVMSQHEET